MTAILRFPLFLIFLFSQRNLWMGKEKSSSVLFRLEGTLQISIISHHKDGYLFLNMSVCSSPFVFLQQPQSQPVFYTAIMVSEPSLQIKYGPLVFNSVLSFVCNGCQSQLESSVCLAFYPISGGYLCESECKNWPELERCSTTTRFDLLHRLYILPMRK